jgi:hypothetical protein
MRNGSGLSGMYTGGALACVLLPCAFLPGSRRRFKGKVLPAVLLAMTLAGSLAMSGCGGGLKYAGTPAGTSTLTITGTSGSIVATTSVTVIVTQ